MTNTILKYHIFPTKRDHKNTLESNNKKKKHCSFFGRIKKNLTRRQRKAPSIRFILAKDPRYNPAG